MRGVNGLHHVTAICGPAQENLDFYAGVLGMRLVKKSVNQDDPGTYHLFYADALGHPGTDLTFFPWEHLAPPRMGYGLAVEVALAVPEESLAFWGERLERYGIAVGAGETRFGEPVLPLVDPHGMRVALVESARAANREHAPWEGSPVPVARQVHGLHAARLWESDVETTAAFLRSVLGFRPLASEAGWSRFVLDAGGSGRVLDLRSAPEEGRGAWGVGSIHHLAFRVEDEEHQLAMRARVAAARVAPTPVIDRFWFKSVYFREPGGVLFELATDGPGFAVDEAPERLGESLVLPPWLEPRRAAIEAALAPLAPAPAS